MVERYCDKDVETFMLWNTYFENREYSPEDEIEVLRTLPRTADVLLMYYNTKYWKAVRQEILERDNFCCVNCGSKVDVQVDHIWYCGFGKEKMVNLQTLCIFCHANKTRKFNILEHYKHKVVKLNMNSTISGVML